MFDQLRGQLLAFQRIVQVATIGIISALGLSLPSQAATPSDVQQLLQTRECAGCDLSGADLSHAHLIGADLREANLQGADLTGTNLEGADLTGANLQGALLNKTYLTNASMNRSNLANANLQQATAFHADTRGANLRNLNLAGAQIYGSGISVGGPLPEFRDDRTQAPEVESAPPTEIPINSSSQLPPAPPNKLTEPGTDFFVPTTTSESKTEVSE